MEKTAKTIGAAVNRMKGNEGKYLTFHLSEEEYGINIMRIREIIGMMPVTPIPQAPDFIKGVINLRGKVIPVIDLRLRFGMDETAYTERTCIVVVELEGGSGSVMMGVIVDSVSEVLNIKSEDMEAAPDFGSVVDTAYIQGMAKMEGGVKILLNINKVLNLEQLSMMETATGMN